ncbi:hypothetical protein M8J77_015825 [Diaphorina citri]|nr:hypothetical protein M8J77_015825 [Diaphorina citri]
MEPDSKKIKDLLHGLGKATQRGIKKCSKCGTYNGTRGVFCKNVMCDAILKNVDDQNYKALIKACKLITDNNTHIFSVRINDKGTDQRGFVQLPLNNSSEGLCFSDECSKTFGSEILKVHEKETLTEKNSTPCQHIEAAKNCVASATSISLNPMIIDSMDLIPNIKEGLWDLLSDMFSTSGPIVQRISKSMFVVKCKTSSQHPLGYLHLTIFNNVKHKDKPDYRHYCACPVEYKDLSSGSEDLNEKKCVHYYAVICSFASDQKLSQEFAHFMESEQMLTLFVNQYLSQEEDNDQLVAIFNVHPEILATADNVSMSQELETVELIASSDQSDLKILSDDMNSVYTYLTIDNSDTPLTTPSNLVPSTTSLPSTSNIAETDKPVGGIDETIENSNENTEKSRNEYKSKKRKGRRNSAGGKEKMPKTNKSAPSALDNHRRLVKYMGKKLSMQTLDVMAKNLKREENVRSDFLRWIGAISERIYQEMHYQFECNKPKTLVFFPTPMNFFECLRERIATLGPKRRLPNSTVAFVSKTPPVGTFTKFVWQLTSIIHVKQVLDNPLFPLKLTRSFVSSGDGLYIPYEPPPDPDPTTSTVDTSSFAKIKPFELITYLKVGRTTHNQYEATPFTVEYIPDLLPGVRMGELKISFEYGHLRPMHNK